MYKRAKEAYGKKEGRHKKRNLIRRMQRIWKVGNEGRF